MPTLEDYRSNLRILIVGDPGSGKSAGVGTLAEHGQELFWCDFDRNLSFIGKLIRRECLKNIHYETLTDNVVLKEGDFGYVPMVEGTTKAYRRYAKLARKWIDSETGEDYGKPSEWESNRWMIWDTVTSMGDASMYYTLEQRKMMGDRPKFREWYEAIHRIQGAVQQFLYGTTNLIVTAHLGRITNSDEDESDKLAQVSKATVAGSYASALHKRYPIVLGRKLPPRFGGYFNVMLQAVRVGSGPSAKYVYRTVPDTDVDVKFPVLGKNVPNEVPNTKLWDLIEMLNKE